MYQDGLLVCVCQLGQQHPSLDVVIEVCGDPDRHTNPIFTRERILQFADQSNVVFQECGLSRKYHLHPDVNYPTYQSGQLQPPDGRVCKTVTQFLSQTTHDRIEFSN